MFGENQRINIFCIARGRPKVWNGLPRLSQGDEFHPLPLTCFNIRQHLQQSLWSWTHGLIMSQFFNLSCLFGLTVTSTTYLLRSDPTCQMSHCSGLSQWISVLIFRLGLSQKDCVQLLFNSRQIQKNIKLKSETHPFLTPTKLNLEPNV